jgi:hypothetical protein
VKARDSGDARDLIEGQFARQMAFDEPKRFLGRIHGSSKPRWKRIHRNRSAPDVLDSPCARGFGLEPALAFRLAEISGKRKSNEGIMAPVSH